MIRAVAGIVVLTFLAVAALIGRREYTTFSSNGAPQQAPERWRHGSLGDSGHLGSPSVIAEERLVRPWWRRVTASGLLSAGTLLAVIAYAISYFFARAFYAQFGLSPTEAGYTQQNAVADAAQYFVALGVALLYLAPVLLLGRIVWRRAAYGLGRRLSPSLTRALRLAALAILCPALAFGATAGFFHLQWVGKERALEMQREDYVPPWVYLQDTPSILPGIQVVFGEARWTTPTAAGSIQVRRTAASLLGVRDGSAIFYDHCDFLVRRVSVEALSFVSTPGFYDLGADEVPEGLGGEGIQDFCGRNFTEPA